MIEHTAEAPRTSVPDARAGLRTEAIAGVTTFLTMAYIVVVNPSILVTQGTGMSFSGVLTATVMGCFVMMPLMGLYARWPFAVAPGMGLNAFFAYTIIIGQHVAWPVALGIIFRAGVLFSVFTPLCFLPCLFLAPLAAMVPTFATTAVLLMIGAAMFRCVATIDFTRIEEALPAFLTIILIPLTFSLTQGIPWGFIAHTGLYLLLGRRREIHPVMSRSRCLPACCSRLSMAGCSNSSDIDWSLKRLCRTTKLS